MHQENPAAPVKIRAAERRYMALTLRRQGGTYREIAEQLRGVEGISKKYSPSQCYSDIITELRRINERNAEAAEEVRRLELERLDELLATYYNKACSGDYASLDRVLAIMDRRARYLDLYKEKTPGAKVDITVFVRQIAQEYGLDPDEAVKEAERIAREHSGSR